MEDILLIYARVDGSSKRLTEQKAEALEKLHSILYGSTTQSSTSPLSDATEAQNAISPRPKTKRVKCLPSLVEVDDEDARRSGRSSSLRGSKNGKKDRSQSSLEKIAAEMKENLAPEQLKVEKSNSSLENIVVATVVENLAPELQQPPSLEPQPTETLLMPPPPPTAVVPDQTEGRPKRLAKIKSEKNLKEPSLHAKLRRPSNYDTSMSFLSVSNMQSKMSVASTASDDSVVVINKPPPLVNLTSDTDQSVEMTASAEQDKMTNVRQFTVKIKREKLSLTSTEETLNNATATAAVVEEQVEQTVVTETVAVMQEAAVENKQSSAQLTQSESMPSNINTTTTTSTTTATTKRTRKKKEFIVAPIKVERFSDIDKIASPIASRTRKGNNERSKLFEPRDLPQEKQPEPRAPSVYEDAIDSVPENMRTQQNNDTKTQQQTTAVNNETITVARTDSSAPVGDATFQVHTTPDGTFVLPNPNATITLPSKNCDTTFNMQGGAANGGADVTFDVPTAASNKDDAAHATFVSAKQSMETAKDANDSLITEDESFERPLIEKKLPPPPPPPPGSNKLKSSAKAYKMPTRTNELFNPLIQSPVKMKVKAFESAANTTKTNANEQGRPKKTIKENSAVSSTGQSKTPLIGKLFGPAVGRFLTPTQASNLASNATANVKKAPSSASKVNSIVVKSNSASIVATTASGGGRVKGAISRENSADDFRKGLHKLAEERKRQREQKNLLAAQQREQKNLLAAQQREAKERERVERMAKLAKEREEKRIRKQLEEEQKKRELEEIQRKLRQNEENSLAELAKMKAAKAKLIADKERQMLQQMKHAGSMKSMLPPPPPRVQNKYTFEMLHTDDSSDEEGKVTYKRPPPPSWSRSHVRGAAIRVQQYWPTEIIDNFFSVQPMTADLRAIFPNIDARHLRRNSSIIWRTPPRYSELPTY